MAIVRDIPKSERPFEDERCIVVEHAGGRFVANGFSPGKMSGAVWAPAAFPTLDEAVAASVAWAERNDVAIVYVRGIAREIGATVK
jgi:hypothetical protein